MKPQPEHAKKRRLSSTSRQTFRNMGGVGAFSSRQPSHAWNNGKTRDQVQDKCPRLNSVGHVGG